METPSELARQILERPVGNGYTFERWLQAELPRLVDEGIQRYQDSTLDARKRLANAIHLPKLNDPIDSHMFDLALTQARTVLNDEGTDGNLYVDFGNTVVATRKTYELQDTQRMAEDDILYTLRAIRDSKGMPSITFNRLGEMNVAFAKMLTGLPGLLPPDAISEDIEVLKSDYSAGMKKLISNMYKLQAREKVSGTHTENLHAKNRLEDHWRKLR